MEVKIVKLVNGDDVVCTIPEQDVKSKWIKVEKPLQIKYVPKVTLRGITDYVALVKWTSYSPDEIVSIPKDKILTVTLAAPKMTESYMYVSGHYDKQGDVASPPGTTEGGGGYDYEYAHTQDQNKYEREELSNDMNRKLNDIFEQFGDDDDPKTYH